MATISRRGAGWFAQIRRTGFTPRYKTFPTKGEAQAWARQQELLIDEGVGVASPQTTKRTTLREILERYKCDVTPNKRGASAELSRLSKMQRSPVCDLAVKAVTPAAVMAYRDQRLREVRPGTVRRELATLRHALDIAAREWGFSSLANPVKHVALPIANDARNRRLERGEIERLIEALASTRNSLLKPIILFAIETGLRRGEIIGLDWKHVCLTKRTAHIPVTKTGIARTIPLTTAAASILASLAEREGPVFRISATALRQAWERTRMRAGMPDLRFHDLRHEAISRFCELGLSIPEIALISGHKDPRMLFRYSHMRAADLANRLSGLIWLPSSDSLS